RSASRALRPEGGEVVRHGCRGGRVRQADRGRSVRGNGDGRRHRGDLLLLGRAVSRTHARRAVRGARAAVVGAGTVRILYSGPLAAGQTWEMRRVALERRGHVT